MRKLKSFDELKDGDKVICQSMYYCYVDKKDGQKFLTLGTSLFPVSEFDAADFVYAETDTSHKCAVTGNSCPYEVNEYGEVPCDYCKCITVEFNYDDDLGKLQQMTKNNIKSLEKLNSLGAITSKEYTTTYQAIHKYYIAELERQLQIAKRKAGMIQI